MERHRKPREQSGKRALLDLMVLIPIAVVAFILSAKFHFFDAVREIDEKFQGWMLDEIVTVMVVLAIGLSVFSIRRWLELRVEVAERKKAQEAQSRFENELVSLVEIGNELSTSESIGELCRRAIELGRAKLDFDRLGIWFCTEKPGEVMGSFGVDEHGNIVDESHKRAKLDPLSPDGRVLTGKALFVKDKKRRITNDKGESIGEATQVFAGIWDGYKVIGHISMDNLISHNPIEEHQCELLRLFGATLGYLCARERTKEALAESEERHRILFEHAREGILVADTETLQFSYSNPAMCQILGYSAKELSSMTVKDIHPSESLPQIMETIESLLKSERDSATNMPFLAKDGSIVLMNGTASEILIHERPCLVGFFTDVTQQKRIEEEHALLATAVEQAEETIIVTDARGAMLYVNKALEGMTGYKQEEAIGKDIRILIDEESGGEVKKEIVREVALGNVWSGRITSRKKSGVLCELLTTITPVRGSSGKIINFVSVSRDVTKEANLEIQLRQAQKMEAIGELASGIAHEINTPSQYVGDNIRFFKESFDGLIDLLKKNRQLVAQAKEGKISEELISSIESLEKEVELDYLIDEIPVAIEQALEGNERINEIIRAMKQFAHPGTDEMTPIDINEAIKTTIAVARNEWKYVAEVQTNLDPGMPMVTCLPGAFNQVMLNIIVNAAHAIGDLVGDAANGKGTITVTTAHDGQHAEIRIADTGAGIPDEIQGRIFDPFFTTKDVGKGTGQGLSGAHAVIVELHKGSIGLETELGKGTTFIIRLPLEQQF